MLRIPEYRARTLEDCLLQVSLNIRQSSQCAFEHVLDELDERMYDELLGPENDRCNGFLCLTFKVTEHGHAVPEEFCEGMWVYLRIVGPPRHDSDSSVHWKNFIVMKRNPVKGIDELHIRSDRESTLTTIDTSLRTERST